MSADRPTASFVDATQTHDPNATHTGDPNATHSIAPARQPDGAPLVPGFEILGELGSGGMGVVWKARQLGLNREVALKMVLGTEQADSKAIIRFLAEAEAMAAIKHPNVVAVYEYGDHDRRPYLVLELQEGGTLAAKLKPGEPLPAMDSAQMMERIARGVQAAHALGIVHRDLKPANILFDAAGEPKVADFGLAKRGAGSDLTRTNALMGTPAYMAPEQASGDARFAGPPADVWALGVILYQCLTGVRPFEADDQLVLLRKVTDEDPLAPRKRVPAIPRDLELIVLKCLSKDASERYPTAGALAEELHRFAMGQPVSVRPAGPVERAAKWAKRRPTLVTAWVLGVLLLLLGGVTALVVSLWQEAVTQREFAVIQQRQAEAARDQLAEQKKEVEAARESEQKAHAQTKEEREKFERFQYGRTMQAAHQEWRQNNVAATLALLEGTRPDLRGWEWHYVHRLCHKVWDARAGADVLTLKGHTDSVSSASFSPDGSRVVTASGDGTAKVWDAKTGAEVLTLEGHTSVVTSASFSADGSRIVTGSGDQTAKVWDAKIEGEALTLKGHPDFVNSASFSADGTRIVTGSWDQTAKVWDATPISREVRWLAAAAVAGTLVEWESSPTKRELPRKVAPPQRATK